MADTGYGITLTFGSSTIGEVLSISTDQSVDVIDTSSADSGDPETEGKNWRDKMAGMKDAGEITCEINRDGSASGEANIINNTVGIGVKDTALINFADGSSFSCEGFITSISDSSSYDDKETTSITITLTGVPTFAAAA